MENNNNNINGDRIRSKKRSSNKSNILPNWKKKVRENCYKRVIEDRNRLLWNIRLNHPHKVKDHHPHNHDDNDGALQTALRDILSDELNKQHQQSQPDDDDALWDYESPNNDAAAAGGGYDNGDCEDILLQMQNIFYNDLKTMTNNNNTWEDDEDDYLARSVLEHMQLNDNQVVVSKDQILWCPICSKGELLQDYHFIFCSLCHFNLPLGTEVNLDILKLRLAQVHAAHLDRGCRLKPNFCIESRFGLTALYISCNHCTTFEVVI